MTTTESPNKLQSQSMAHRMALWVIQSRTEAPVRNPRLSEEDCGMYIQRGSKVRTHSRRLALRDGIKLQDRDLVDRQERCRVGAWDQPWPRGFYPRGAF